MKVYLASNGQGNPNWRRICFNIQTNTRMYNSKLDRGYWKYKNGTLIIWEL